MKHAFLKSVVLFVILLLLLVAVTPALAETWRFGVMSDTQWTVPDDGRNPNSVAVDIANQINAQFIKAHVKFVIQVGDLTDNGSNIALDTRAQAAQALYNAGIGFYPLRGNHESSQAGALEFQLDFPQTQGQGKNVFGARRFSSPSAPLQGLSYSFVYRGAKFVLLDQFTRLDGSGSGSTNTNNFNIADQLSWINSTLADRLPFTHAFVFAHKNLIGQNHVDFLLGSDPSQNPDLQNSFISALQANGVRYYISGHDHTHHRSIVTSPDGKSQVQQLIGASDSSKFYIPAIPSNDQQYDNPTREVPIAQQLNRVGYYIFTVDGPQVTVDYYSAEVNPTLIDGEYLIATTPTLQFVKQETFGYSLNGKEFLVPEGGSYTSVQDGFLGTSARILAGTNESTATDGSERPLTKTVNTGWALPGGSSSSVLTLVGLGDLGSAQTDVYTLSLTYNPWLVRPDQLLRGKFGLATRDGYGTWVNAVDANSGGTKEFVLGPWKSSYGLGTYGVDPRTHTAWAVLNYSADFAVAEFSLHKCGDKD